MLLLALAGAASAGDWPQWRGPNFDGSSDEERLPERLGDSSNRRWVAELPGEGASTPIVVGGRVYVTAIDRKAKLLCAYCFGASDGKALWRRSVAYERPATVPHNTLASPSPVADGERVVFLFGAGAFLACDVRGRVLWRRDLEQEFGPLAFEFFYSASPLLYRGRLYLSVLRNDHVPDRSDLARNLDSFLLCVDPATGKDVWRRDRPSDAEGIENRESYATPLPLENGGEGQVVLIGANYVTGHDWLTGSERFRFGYGLGETYRQRVVPTPVVAGGLLVAVKPRAGAVFSIRTGLRGEAAYGEAPWVWEGDTPDTPSPLLYRGRLYCVQDKRKTLTCLDPKTGKPLWSGDLGGNALFHASPTAGAGMIYCVNLAGEVVVAKAGERFETLSRASLGGRPCRSSVAIANGRLYVRTADSLYCFGSPLDER